MIAIALLSLLSLATAQQANFGPVAVSQPSLFYFDHNSRGQPVIHPNQPANTGLISAQPASSPEQQLAWDNAAPIVVRANNKPPQYNLQYPQQAQYNHQQYYVVPSAYNQLHGHQQVYGSPLAYQNAGGYAYSPSHVVGAVAANQGYVYNSQHVPASSPPVPSAGYSTEPKVPSLYGSFGNVHGDTVVTNDPVQFVPSVNFANLRPGNVRRLEEPVEVESYDGVDASFNEPSGLARDEAGKTNYQQEEQSEQQQPEVKSVFLGRRQPVVIPERPSFRFGKRREQPLPSFTRVVSYGTKSRAEGTKQQVQTQEPEPVQQEEQQPTKTQEPEPSAKGYQLQANPTYF
ncbi:hypothetical protein HDE_12126 [Halotydeus destructor]|nr:hypothetical protein HDE_12126 [Halotydeus destructor]